MQLLPDNETVLLVDDHPTILKAIEFALKEQNINTCYAFDGSSALELISLYKPAVILLDIMLPDVNGLHFCSELVTGKYGYVPRIIIMSSLNDSETKLEAFRSGCIDFVVKAFDPLEICARVEAHMSILRMEKELQKNSLRLEAENTVILESLNQGVISVNKQSRIMSANSAALNILECTNADIHKHLFSYFFSTSFIDVNKFKDFYEFICFEVNGTKLDVDATTFTGREFKATLTISPLLMNDEITGAVVVFEDLTEKLMKEQALAVYERELKINRDQLAHLERLSSMGEMAAGLAHEITQPLTAISNFSSSCIRLLEKDSDKGDAKISEYLQQIANQSDRAGKIISKLRDFIAKAESEYRLVNLLELVSEALLFCNQEIKENNISVFFNSDDQYDYFVLADYLQIQQVVVNLIRNSIDAINSIKQPDGKIWVKLEFSNGFYKVSVEDNGCGFSSGVAENVFYPFFTTKKQGMGIGLSICETILRAHEGSISAEQGETGARFVFNLKKADA